MAIKLGIKARLIIIFTAIVLVSLLTLSILTYFRLSSTLNEMIQSEMNNVSLGGVNTMNLVSELYIEQVKSNIKLLDSYTRNAWINKGQLKNISVINQATNDVRSIDIQTMLIDNESVLYNYKIVDYITEYTGSTATIFQLIPGGLLRISTSVKKSDETRAVGTFIGNDSPVYQSILKGETYIGKALVLDKWYITAYRPLYDKNSKELIGCIYVGVKPDPKLFRDKILSTKIAEKGYIYIVDVNGTLIIHPQIEGQNLLNNPDADGNLFMKEICDKKNGFIRYKWKNPGDKYPVDKFVLYKNVPNLDWIVCVTANIKDINKPINSLRNIIIITVSVFITLTIIIILIVSQTIASPINKVTNNLTDSSKQLESASYQISAQSQELSSGANELAASVEEITSSLEELQSVIELNTKNINESEVMMKDTSIGSKKVSDKMTVLNQSLVEIKDNSKKIVKVIKVIDDIAFQTNILALNAAVEARKAGAAGLGFSVVAEQVKSLAEKSAVAAKETAELIEKAMESALKGGELGTEVIDVQLKTQEFTEKVSVLLDEVNRTSKEQLKGINQITQAVNQTNSMVQQTASSSEETAAAGEELLNQSSALNNVVDSLNVIIKGTKQSDQKTTETKLVQDKTNKVDIRKKSNKVIVDPEKKIPLEDDFKDF